MIRVVPARILFWTAAMSLAVVLAGVGRPAVAQQKQPAAKGAEAKKADAKKAKKFRGRLPAYYRHVVDEKQREAIYKIQEEYAAKLAALKAQLAALTQERNDKVAAVLTPEQKAKVEKLKAEARAKRKREKSETKKPAVRAPARKAAKPAAPR